MNQNQLAFPGDLAIAMPTDARLDQRKRDIVQFGISVQESSNTMSAVEFLKSRDIAAEVIERVLLDPRRRRNMS